jgi:hypothetical protein
MINKIILITSSAGFVGFMGGAFLQVDKMVAGSYLNGITYIDAYLLMLFSIASALMLAIMILEVTRR